MTSSFRVQDCHGIDVPAELDKCQLITNLNRRRRHFRSFLDVRDSNDLNETVFFFKLSYSQVKDLESFKDIEGNPLIEKCPAIRGITG
jgi:hypothetical protein